MNKKENIQQIYPLTPMQEAMLFHSLYESSNAYFCQTHYRSNGALNIEALEYSLDYLAQRHEILRTAFVYKQADRPLQVVLKSRRPSFRTIDLSHLSEAEQKKALADFRQADMDQGFDLVKEPLLRLSLLQLGTETYEFVWSFHHIIMDGWCLPVIIGELKEVYYAYLEQRKAALSEPIPFNRYVQWLGKQNQRTSLDYWKTYLQGYNSLAVIPPVSGWDEATTPPHQTEVLTIGSAAVNRINELVKKEGVTLNAFFQSLWGILLARYNQTNDVVFGNVVSGRPADLPGVESMLGLFINTIPQRVYFNPDTTFSGLLKQLHHDFMGHLPHQYCSLSEIQAESVMGNSLMHHVFVFENYPTEKAEHDPAIQDPLEARNVTAIDLTNYEFDVEVTAGAEVDIHINYRSRTYEKSYVTGILRQFDFLVNQVLDQPDILIDALELTDPQERTKQFTVFNKGRVDLNNRLPIPHYFEAQLDRFGEHTAIVHGEQETSFNTLNTEANKIAALLGTLSIKSGDVVGVYLPRTPELIYCIMGILKAGAVYLPLDTQHLPVRIWNLISGNPIPALITATGLLESSITHAGNAASLKTIICIDDASATTIPVADFSWKLYDQADIVQSAISNPQVEIELEDPAYVLFTSGSTGVPKGAVSLHKGSMNHILAELDALALAEGFRFLQSAGIASDVSVWQMLAPLMKGGTVVIIDKEDLLDYKTTLQLLEAQRIHIVEWVPSYVVGLLDYIEQDPLHRPALADLQWVMMTGEELPVPLVNRWMTQFPQSKMLNAYGPCEASDDIAQYVITAPLEQVSRVPVGMPIANMNIFILDKNGKLLPTGIPGELCVSGDGVGAGYLNDPVRTAKQFIPNPFEETLGDTYYRTGDLARWLPDGNLEFLGRIDLQVKIRGQRVELEEIENCFRVHPDISDAVVVLQPVQEEMLPVAYLIPKSEQGAGMQVDTQQLEEELRIYSRERLESFMRPVAYVFLQAYPLNLSDKVDRKALPVPELKDTDKELIIPVDEIEEQLLAVWQKTLGKTAISTTDNFFDIGGHSLSATRLAIQVNKQLKANILLRTIFNYPTIKELAQHIRKGTAAETSIPLLPAQDHYDLSHAQQRLWLSSQLSDKQFNYNMPDAYRFSGDFDATAFDKAFTALLARHETLRTGFIVVEGEPRQVIHPVSEASAITHLDWQGKADSYALAMSYVQELSTMVFDLAKPPLFKAVLIQTGSNTWVFGFVIHHIITDGWSSGILIRDLLTIYHLLLGNKPAPLKPLTIQYKEYAAWHKGKMQEKEVAVHRNYWMDQFKEPVAALELPLDFPRRSNTLQGGATISLKIDADLLEQARAVARQQEGSLFMLLIALVKVLLHRYTSQDEIVIGTPSAGREHNELEEQVGFYVNPLALRTKFDDGVSFRQYFKQVRAVALDAYEHQVYPFDQLVDDLNIKREAGRMSLFDVMVVLQDAADDMALTALSDGMILEELALESKSSKFDLLFEFEEKKDGLNLSIEYSTDLFKEGRIERMGSHLVNILNEVVRDADQPVATLQYLDDREIEELMLLAGDHSLEEAGATVPSLLSGVASRYPGLPALSDGVTTYNYEALWERSGLISGYLQQACGVQHEALVGIVMGRGTGFVLAMLGILRSGAAYLPIESHQPPERIRQLLHAGGVSVVLTDDAAMQGLLGDDFNCVDLEEAIAAGIKTEDAKASGSSLAYVMFTSGSTGEPKGVMVEHRSIVRLVRDTHYVVLDTHDRILQTAALSFDVTTFEIWGALLNGGMVYVTSLESLLDATSLREQIEAYGITKMWFTSSWFNQLADHAADLFSGMEQILVGGEQLSVSHVGKVLAHCPGLRVTNGYGPTENTTFSACGDVRQEDISSGVIRLGYPISKSLVYIVDKEQQLVGKGIYGELLLGGEGVSRGYINDAERTAKSFITSPFVAGERLYRSGDIGCWDEEGRIIFRGRKDNQVKIRGYRVEPLEIALVLKGHEAIQEAVVRVHITASGEKQLAAYYTGEAGKDAALRSWLKEQLPAYMVPTYFMWLAEMPLNKNGKLDQQALPDVAMASGSQELVAPANELESLLLDIWESLLGRKGISTTDHFFEIGANSLTAVKMGYRIRELTGIHIELGSIFKYPDIQSLARLLSTQVSEQQHASIPRRAAGSLVPLSFSQERLWFIDRLQGSTQYHIPAVLRLTGALDITALEKAFLAITDRHEILRTVIRDRDGIAYQEIGDQGRWQMEPVLTMDQADALLAPAIIAQIERPFILSEDSPLRVQLLRLSAQEHLLVIVMHHIASDGSSLPVLIDELSELYLSQIEGRAPVLAALDIQYGDYASWQRSAGYRPIAQDQLYWQQQLSGVATLELPTDYLRPAMMGIEGGQVELVLSEALNEKLQTLALQQGVTMYMLLLSVFKVLLYRYSGQGDICIGTPVAGRNDSSLEPLIGFFVNTLPIRTDLSGNPRFTELLDRVKEVTIAAYSHQSIPFEQMVEVVAVDRDISRHPLFQVMFAFLKTEQAAPAQLGDVAIAYEPLPHHTAKFDLNVEIEQAEDLHISIEYNKDLYKAATIERLADHYHRLLTAICDDPEQEIASLDMISASEQQQILKTFNATEQHYPAATILELFAQQVQKTPDHIAVAIEGAVLSYKALDEKSNDLAAYLMNKTGGQEVVIGVCLERSLEMVVSLWGILKAGAAYVPLDPEYPADRMRYILEDTGATLLISTNDLLKDKEALGTIEILDITTATIPAVTNAATITVSAARLAYIIYTSGSTGRPKGVMIEHGSLANRLQWAQQYFNLTEQDSVLQKTTYCFDVSVWELFWPMLTGARLVLAQPEGHKDAFYLKGLISSESITMVHFVPSMLEVFLESLVEGDCAGLKNVLCSGEALKPEHAQQFSSKLNHTHLHNLYGPTEAAIDVSYWTMPMGADVSVVPIGRPVANTQLYILDRQLRVLPVGIAGELYIGGVQLARGYRNLTTLTAERFIEHELAPGHSVRLYRTGDLVKWQPDGNIAYLGRLDDQVKIRGYRIELGEIENTLLQYAGMRQAKVTVLEDATGNKRLIGYIVAASSLDQSALSTFLQAKLPEYMIPSVWVAMESLPLTASGKVDKKALPVPADLGIREQEYIAPRNETEEKLSVIWGRLLGIEQVGVYDNFFKLGGHSLLVIRLVALIREQFKLEVNIKLVFEQPDIASLAKVIDWEIDQLNTETVLYEEIEIL